MKINNFSKIALSLGLAISVFACSTNMPNTQSQTNSTKIEKNTIDKSSNGIISINLNQLFNNSKNGFSIKRFKFDDSTITKVKISVYSASVDTIATNIVNGVLVPETSKLVNKNDFSQVTLSVASGNNKVVVIEGEDDQENVLTTLMSAINIVGGKKTTLNVNAGTYPTARILKTLMESPTQSDRILASNFNLDKLQIFINGLTGYDVNTNTYGGINPAFLDTNLIIAHLKANELAHTGSSIPFYKDDNKANLFIDYPGSGNIPAIDTQKYDNETKGKLRITVKNSIGVILKNSKITINDLTSDNVINASSTDDTTIIDNVSQGKWLLKVTASDGGNTIYAQQNVIVSSGNTEQSITIIPVVNKSASVDFDAPDNNYYNDNNIDNINNVHNIPAPTSFQLNVGSSTTVKAHVTMVDKTKNTNLTWTSSNTSVANVSGGSISGLAVGTATIKFASTDDPTIFKTVTVTVLPATTGDGPTITSFSPNFVTTGTLVTISGTNFDDSFATTTAISFNGVAAIVASNNITKTQIKVLVPTGVTSGMISVSTSKGNYVSRDIFFINSATNNTPANPLANTTGMVYVPGNSFYMGKDGTTTDNFYPRHKVNVKGYYIDRTDITNSQFNSFIQAGGYTNSNYWPVGEALNFRDSNNLNNADARPSYWNDTRFNRPDQPVVGISWYEAQAYAIWLGRTLPTEAQWEYAARGKDERSYPWGGDSPSGANVTTTNSSTTNNVINTNSNRRANGYFGGTLGDGDGYQYSNEVGKITDGDSPFGLKDMAGNVYQWVSDNYDASYYKTSPMDDPKGPSFGGSRVLRGGSWYNHPYFNNDLNKLNDSLLSYSRFYSSPANRSNYIGFRTTVSN
ncbi:MAG: SUMF1/EgtB/PvdO family nonheme iron enzyme [Candidatus Sericytochromatia bacterium]|nr:SUMF1/EgtB/PvdO family nonheme iron enzyme [Candidatus Sericytochromatia bacterium]